MCRAGPSHPSATSVHRDRAPTAGTYRRPAVDRRPSHGGPADAGQLALSRGRERLVGALPALHARLVAYAGLPLVIAARRPPALALCQFLPAMREDVLAATKETGEQLDLALRRPRCPPSRPTLGRVVCDRTFPLRVQLGELSSRHLARPVERAQSCLPSHDCGVKLSVCGHRCILHTEPAYTCTRGRLARRRALQRHELAVGLAVGGELEAEHGVAVERLGEASQRFGAGAVLAALDPGDDRGGRAHALGDLLLRETEVRAAHDRDPRDLLKWRQALVGFAVALAARELALDVLADARSD